MTADTRCYTIAQVLERLQMTPTVFYRLRAQGALPFLEEILPRLGRYVRYRAEPIDRYLAGQWGQPRAFAAVRRQKVG